ncbi:hypothetical protein FGW20_08775 [Methanoculleus sp. FWC-SCC3]|uniref:DUF4190 domain-containing protein n=1 Tax=Methanoculleus methanifontis TaxID=2584086 RepID=A0ABT8M2P3_9EURY|nr:hypothetical protein [Methanoculleus sp. FWC-SCC3]MDN7013132.1 hypothetical protein [Methanoculleus sp. FWC-SCC3]
MMSRGSTSNSPSLPAPKATQTCEGTAAKVILSPGEAYAYIGIALGILGLLIVPIVFSAAGIIFGYLAMKNGEGPFGKVAMIISTASLAVGIIAVVAILTYVGII